MDDQDTIYTSSPRTATLEVFDENGALNYGRTIPGAAFSAPSPPEESSSSISSLSTKRPFPPSRQSSSLLAEPSRAVNPQSTSPAVSFPLESPVASTSNRVSLPAARRKHACTYPGCDKSFQNSGHLARHIRVHTGEKRFECTFPECGSRFARHDNMLQHYRNHIQRVPRKRKPPGPIKVAGSSTELPPIKGKGRVKGKTKDYSETSPPRSISLETRSPGAEGVGRYDNSGQAIPGWQGQEVALRVHPAPSPVRYRFQEPITQSGLLSASGSTFASSSVAATASAWQTSPLPSPSIFDRPRSAFGNTRPQPDEHYFNVQPPQQQHLQHPRVLVHRHSYSALSHATGAEGYTPVVEHGDPFGSAIYIDAARRSAAHSTASSSGDGDDDRSYSHSMAGSAAGSAGPTQITFPPIQSSTSYLDPTGYARLGMQVRDLPQVGSSGLYNEGNLRRYPVSAPVSPNFAETQYATMTNQWPLATIDQALPYTPAETSYSVSDQENAILSPASGIVASAGMPLPTFYRPLPGPAVVHPSMHQYVEMNQPAVLQLPQHQESMYAPPLPPEYWDESQWSSQSPTLSVISVEPPSPFTTDFTLGSPHTQTSAVFAQGNETIIGHQVGGILPQAESSPLHQSHVPSGQW